MPALSITISRSIEQIGILQTLQYITKERFGATYILHYSNRFFGENRSAKNI